MSRLTVIETAGRRQLMINPDYTQYKKAPTFAVG